MTALKRTIAEERGDGSGGPGPARQRQQAAEAVVVGQADFLAALRVLTPSLSLEEVARYEHIRDQYNAAA